MDWKNPLLKRLARCLQALPGRSLPGKKEVLSIP